ncbi:precorrin-6A reductase [Lutispora sp.]|uniref:precorrin-6A reductase n=1 Tax=Lutispora sp. TaxID=2828727 RepID=UPI002B20F220|nr:precorrin-6A reductase [Lutispora sp.]MEA4960049.1 precorrin-6A reductase [Lutispora sp.]
MIWIIGGTAETREIIDRIKDMDNYIITSATDSEKEFIPYSNLVVGRMDYASMADFIDENHISLIVDLSHPYAAEVTENAKRAAQSRSIKYVRYVRSKVELEGMGTYLRDYDECLDFLKRINGSVFFTTGSKNIGEFEKIRNKNRFIYRILPAPESIEECRKHEIRMKDIVAVLGPFSKEFNKAMFAEYDVDYVVMKDSGREGGTIEKIQACRELGIMPIIIGRRDEEGIYDIDEIENIIRMV